MFTKVVSGLYGIDVTDLKRSKYKIGTVQSIPFHSLKTTSLFISLGSFLRVTIYNTLPYTRPLFIIKKRGRYS